MSGHLSNRALSFTPSVIQETSRLAEKYGAINLAEGFPDFPAPTPVKDAAIATIKGDLNQYRHVPQLCDLVAERFAARHSSPSQLVLVDPATEVVITCGQTEAMAAAILAVVDPGDEVVLFSPTYETYPANVAMAGGINRYVKLTPPDWSFHETKLRASVSPRCKAIILNSPHNPTGKVFSDNELDIIARICTSNDLLALTDEVYEELTYDGVEHRSLASLPGMKTRTVVTSSLSKTFAVTGWRIGWAIAPPAIAAAISNLHVKLTDSAPAPFQEAAVVALQSDVSYYRTLKREYQERRDLICDALEAAGFEVGRRPRGGFFVFAEVPERFSQSSDDVTFVKAVIRDVGVALVPGSIFFPCRSLQPVGQNGSSDTADFDKRCKAENLNTYEGSRTELKSRMTCGISCDGVNPSYEAGESASKYVRVALCKKLSTLEDAAVALEQLESSNAPTSHIEHADHVHAYPPFLSGQVVLPHAESFGPFS